MFEKCLLIFKSDELRDMHRFVMKSVQFLTNKTNRTTSNYVHGILIETH